MLEEKEKKNTEESEKKRFREEIQYLRKVIREMQTDKMKSIDVDPNYGVTLSHLQRPNPCLYPSRNCPIYSPLSYCFFHGGSLSFF